MVVEPQCQPGSLWGSLLKKRGIHGDPPLLGGAVCSWPGCSPRPPLGLSPDVLLGCAVAPFLVPGGPLRRADARSTPPPDIGGCCMAGVHVGRHSNKAALLQIWDPRSHRSPPGSWLYWASLPALPYQEDLARPPGGLSAGNPPSASPQAFGWGKSLPAASGVPVPSPLLGPPDVLIIQGSLSTSGPFSVCASPESAGESGCQLWEQRASGVGP